MPYTVIIPARYASQRLPAKPLSMIAGHTMIERVYRRALKSQAEQVIIATDDQRIADAALGFGAEVCVTSKDHQSGTDRLHEVAQKYSFSDDHIVVNVQGDEPLIPPAVIDQVAKNLQKNTDVSAATLSEKIQTVEAMFDPNIVKVVTDTCQRALYFSRASIPWSRDDFTEAAMSLPDIAPQRHIGIYAYRVGLLKKFVAWPMSPLEKIEKLEQLRLLFNGQTLHVEEACEEVPGGVDTAEDLQRVIRYIRQQKSVD